MSLPNPSVVFGRFLLRSTSPRLSTTSGFSLSSINLFRLASLLALLVELDLFFLISALACFFKITKVAPYESVEEFCKDLFLALYFSLVLSMIFLLFCLLPSSVLFMLTTWPLGPPLLRSLLRWRPHEEL